MAVGDQARTTCSERGIGLECVGDSASVVAVGSGIAIGGRSFYNRLPSRAVPNPPRLAPSGLADDFVVLGKSDGLAAQANKLGGRHLMGSADWRADVLSTISNPNSRIAVALDGLEGTGSISSRVMAGVQRGASSVGSPFDWELAQLYRNGRLSTTELFENGVAISNPFG